MNSLLAEMNYLRSFCYMDDVIITAESLESHSQKLRELFQRLREGSLETGWFKCDFMRAEFQFLGHSFSDKVLLLDSKKDRGSTKLPRNKNGDTAKRIPGAMLVLLPVLAELGWGGATAWLSVENKRKVRLEGTTAKRFQTLKSVNYSTDFAVSGLLATVHYCNRRVAWSCRLHIKPWRSRKRSSDNICW